VNATLHSATDVPVTAPSYNATGNTINFTLKLCSPHRQRTRTASNTGLPFIQGTFSNLAQGQAVTLSYAGTNYNFVATTEAAVLA